MSEGLYSPILTGLNLNPVDEPTSQRIEEGRATPITW
jgi:hypothetical protein